MDPALLKARQDFMRHAISSMDTLQQIKKDGSGGATSSSSTSQQKSKRKRVVASKDSKTAASSSTGANNNNAIQNAANFRFGFYFLGYFNCPVYAIHEDLYVPCYLR